jgi:hypothetical protein
VAGLSRRRLRHRPDDRGRRRDEHHLSPLTGHQRTPESPLAEDDLVWYVAYGSNLQAARFGCYLAGGRPPGARREYAGCRDTTPWRDAAPVEVPGRLCFGGVSPTWGGGLAYLDPDADGTARGRGYLLTAGQLRDVAAQEARVAVGSGPALTREAGSWGEADPPAYEHVAGLGERDGHPMFTLTTRRRMPPAPPAPAYVGTIVAGLLEAYGGSPADHAAYLMDAGGVADGWTAAELVALAGA